jgi:TldD protein
LVSAIETQRQAQGTARPPIVEPPPLDDAKKGGQ